MAARPSGNKTISARKAEEKSGPTMASRHEIESARLTMLEARKALEDYETLKGFTTSLQHKTLSRVFDKATQTYLELSASQR